MQRLSFRKVLWMAVACFVAIAVVIMWPVLQKSAPPRLFCKVIEIDLNSARLRKSQYVLFARITQSVEATALSLELERLELVEPPAVWIEATIATGKSDYRLHGIGGDLLSSIQNVSLLITNRPQVLTTNSDVAIQISKALRSRSDRELREHITTLVDRIKP